MKQEAHLSLLIYRKTLKKSSTTKRTKKTSLFASFKSRFSKLTFSQGFSGISKDHEYTKFKLNELADSFNSPKEKIDPKPQSNEKYLVSPDTTTKNKFSFPVNIELISTSRNKKENTLVNTPIILKNLNSDKDHSSVEESLIKNDLIERKVKNLEDLSYLNLKDSGRDYVELMVSSTKNRRNSQISNEDPKEEIELMKRVLKLKQNEIADLSEKMKNLQKELHALKIENSRLMKENTFIEKREIKEIKQFEAKQNDSYFKEKELDGQYTLPNSSFALSIDNKEFKEKISEKQLKDSYYTNKSIIVSFDQIKLELSFNFKNKAKICKYGMISCLDLQIIQLYMKGVNNCEISIQTSKSLIKYYDFCEKY